MPESATEYYKKVASHLFSSLGWPCGYRIVFLGSFFGVFFLGGGGFLGNFGQFWAILGVFLGSPYFAIAQYGLWLRLCARFTARIRLRRSAMCSFHCAHTPPQVGYVLVSLRAYAAHRSRGGVLPFEDRNCRPISFGSKSFDRRFTKL